MKAYLTLSLLQFFYLLYVGNYFIKLGDRLLYLFLYAVGNRFYYCTPLAIVFTSFFSQLEFVCNDLL